MNSSFNSDSTHFTDGDLNDENHETDEGFINFKKYALEVHTPDLIRILLEEDRNIHYSLVINGSDFLEKNVNLSTNLFFHSEKTLKMFDLACLSAKIDIYRNHTLQKHMKVKPYVHVRFKKLPKCAQTWRDRIPKSKDINLFLSVDGTVIRTCSAKVLQSKVEYKCTKCSCVFTVKADFKLHHSFAAPLKCPVTTDCPSQRFVAVTESKNNRKNCKDYQEIKVQEQVRKLSMGTIPRSIVVILEDDLVDSCKAGDDVVVTGTVTCRWKPLVAGKNCDLELVIKANNIEVCNNTQKINSDFETEEIKDEFNCFWACHTENTLVARNHILKSLCPQVYGLYVVKLATALSLAGGVSRIDQSGSHIRGESHLLLVGDPGTGKSQFLKYAAKIIPRSVLTTGIGSSTAGLTVSAIRDGPQWILEAGALVLSDGGVCCIDEFSGIREQDRCAIHEAMEQQSISVAKAGLVCKLNTRTTVLAATNPKLGRYDDSSNISLNVGMASPLLSRFDVILVLRDTQNQSWDSVVADYLLNDEADDKSTSNLWNLQQMQAYFSIIHELKPILSADANEVLKAYYRRHRNSSCRNEARTTIRLLESLVRLSEAHARLMYREQVLVQDAIVAITVMESSMEGGSLLPTGNILHSCFPKDPEREYLKHCRLILDLLDLQSIAEKYISNFASSKSTSGKDEEVSLSQIPASQDGKLFSSSNSDIVSILPAPSEDNFSFENLFKPKSKRTKLDISTTSQSTVHNSQETLLKLIESSQKKQSGSKPDTFASNSLQSRLSKFQYQPADSSTPLDSKCDDETLKLNEGIDWDALIDDELDLSMTKPSTQVESSQSSQFDIFKTPAPKENYQNVKTPKREFVSEALSRIFNLDDVDLDL